MLQIRIDQLDYPLVRDGGEIRVPYLRQEHFVGRFLLAQLLLNVVVDLDLVVEQDEQSQVELYLGQQL
jgi:hypothetical protein